MSLQICIKTNKPLQHLATEICKLFALPSFNLDMHAQKSYYQFEILGMLVFIYQRAEEDCDPEVSDYGYCFDLQMSFTEHELDTDAMEYHLQPYYAQLLAFQLDLETACYEKKKVGPHWQIRYCFYAKNAQWNASILFGEPDWQPAVITYPPSPWRAMRSLE
jgi:hypothetical protein